MLETKRLTIRPFLESDIDAVFHMRSDSEVMRFIRDPQVNREQTRAWIEMISSKWESGGIGFCAVVENETGDFAGWCGLWLLKETNEIEVGYAIRKDLWGLGYASEAAERVLQYGFNDLGLERIVAVAFPENVGSVSVMKKLGMKYVKLGRFYDQDLVQYAITKDLFHRDEGD